MRKGFGSLAALVNCAAGIYSLVETDKLNGVDPEGWLADIIARIADHPVRRVVELLPWNYRPG